MAYIEQPAETAILPLDQTTAEAIWTLLDTLDMFCSDGLSTLSTNSQRDQLIKAVLRIADATKAGGGDDLADDMESSALMYERWFTDEEDGV